MTARPSGPPTQRQDPRAGVPGIDLDAAQDLINRLFWIALLLTPLAGTTSKRSDEIAGVVADLDALVHDLRLAAAGADEVREDRLEDARRVLHDVRARLGALWAEGLSCGADPLRTNRLAEASHLVRGALIALQGGAVV